MNMSIKTRDHGVVTFFMNSNGGYVYFGNNCTGDQICHGGKWRGNTITATPETFESTVRKWHRARMRLVNDNGYEY
jgi:hypothetical protein